MTRALTVAAWVACLMLGSTRSASAFSDPELYAEPAEVGGGAGRQFTGSPMDAHSCSVCHRGGIEPDVSIEGLPSRFAPGERYTVRLQWEDDPEISHSLQLELVTSAGQHPRVELLPTPRLPRRSRCDSDDNGIAAVYAHDTAKRRVLGVMDCGASEISFTFTAPDEPRIFFAAGIVRSDSSGTAEGDGVVEVRTTLLRTGEPAPESAGCNASAGTPRDTSGWSLLLATLAAAAWRRRARVA